MNWLIKALSKSKKKGGFTLVELMIVVVIVGILAAVGLALYRGYVKRAVATEGIAGLGTLRTGLRVNYAETKDYSVDGAGVTISTVFDIPGIDIGDLDGTYFVDGDYSITSIDPVGFTVNVKGSLDKAADIEYEMDQAGTITNLSP